MMFFIRLKSIFSSSENLVICHMYFLHFNYDNFQHLRFENKEINRKETPYSVMVQAAKA